MCKILIAIATGTGRASFPALLVNVRKQLVAPICHLLLVPMARRVVSHSQQCGGGRWGVQPTVRVTVCSLLLHLRDECFLAPLVLSQHARHVRGLVAHAQRIVDRVQPKRVVVVALMPTAMQAGTHGC